MRTKEEIIIEVFGKNGGIHGLLYKNQNYIEHAMQQYAEEYHKAELLKLNKSDIISSVCKHCGCKKDKHTVLRMCLDRLKHFEAK